MYFLTACTIYQYKEEWSARHGNDKLPTPIAHIIHLRHDLVLQIPGKDQDVVRLCFCETRRWVNWQTASGQKASLLMRIKIDDVVDKIRPDPAVIEQRIALGRRSISRDGFAISFARWRKSTNAVLRARTFTSNPA